MGDNHFLKYNTLFEAKNPITGNEHALMMGNEPDIVRIVDLSGQFSDERYGTVMCVGFIKDQNRWVCNHGERVAIKLLLARIAELEAQLAKAADTYHYAQGLAEKALTWIAENAECPSDFYYPEQLPKFCGEECTSEYDCGTTECSRDCWERYFEKQETE